MLRPSHSRDDSRYHGVSPRSRWNRSREYVLEVWDNDYSDKFGAAEIWRMIREHKVEVQCHKLVWFPQGVPRYGFIAWLAVRDRLATGHRTCKWGQPQVFVYRGKPDETRDHLFLHVCLLSRYGSGYWETFSA